MTAARRRFAGARMRLALSYALFLVGAGVIVLAAVYVVLRTVPNYPLTAANPRDAEYVPSRQEILEILLSVSGLILIGLAVVGVVGGWFLAGWVLRPLSALRDAAAVAATGRLDARVRLRARGDEFGEVADAFDHMLARLKDAFDTQERFALNASHELRTPLAVTATMLEVAATEPSEPDYPRLLARLREVNDRAIGITEALLRLADATAVTAAAQPVDLDPIVEAALAEAAEPARRHRVALRAELSGGTVTGDAALLARTVANLVDNAVRHNVPGGSAIVSTAVGRGGVVLRVANTGREYSPAEADRLREPFLRGAGRGKADGHGLGLTLVDRIVAVHSGELSVEPRRGGGLVVTVRLRSSGTGRTCRTPVR